jgi:hypothetical protein
MLLLLLDERLREDVGNFKHLRDLLDGFIQQ